MQWQGRKLSSLLYLWVWDVGGNAGTAAGIKWAVKGDSRQAKCILLLLPRSLFLAPQPFLARLSNNFFIESFLFSVSALLPQAGEGATKLLKFHRMRLLSRVKAENLFSPLATTGDNTYRSRSPCSRTDSSDNGCNLGGAAKKSTNREKREGQDDDMLLTSLSCVLSPPRKINSSLDSFKQGKKPTEILPNLSRIWLK